MFDVVWILLNGTRKNFHNGNENSGNA